MPGCIFNFLYDNTLPLVFHIRRNEVINLSNHEFLFSIILGSV